MIFHLSYDFKVHKSFNHYIPEKYCLVTYQDLDYAIQTCLKWSGKDPDGNDIVFLSKGDIRSAFRVISGWPSNWRWTILKATDPRTGKDMFWVDKNLPFGSSVSCSLFQRFSNCVEHIVEVLMGRPMLVTNFLDDYLFVAPSRSEANEMARTFISVATQMGLSIAEEKTEWATTSLIFLGILIIGDQSMIAVPEVK